MPLFHRPLPAVLVSVLSNRYGIHQSLHHLDLDLHFSKRQDPLPVRICLLVPSNPRRLAGLHRSKQPFVHLTLQTLNCDGFAQNRLFADLHFTCKSPFPVRRFSNSVSVGSQDPARSVAADGCELRPRHQTPNPAATAPGRARAQTLPLGLIRPGLHQRLQDLPHASHRCKTPQGTSLRVRQHPRRLTRTTTPSFQHQQRHVLVATVPHRKLQR
mmetsp:Transcript_67456/g.101714  ORF Transcript_67456/g.101714 Transcript_67456/m.101714 type:complete len:214 (-) Transcript_67456:1822-2463(-)